MKTMAICWIAAAAAASSWVWVPISRGYGLMRHRTTEANTSAQHKGKAWFSCATVHLLSPAGTPEPAQQVAAVIQEAATATSAQHLLQQPWKIQAAARTPQQSSCWPTKLFAGRATLPWSLVSCGLQLSRVTVYRSNQELEHTCFSRAHLGDHFPQRQDATMQAATSEDMAQTCEGSRRKEAAFEVKEGSRHCDQGGHSLIASCAR